MSLRFARYLAIGGMVATVGTLTVGSQAFRSTPASASASSSSTPNTGPDASSPSSPAVTVAPMTASSTPVPGSNSQVAYVAGDAATLIIDSAGGAMRLVTFAPHPGWFTVRLDQPSATQLEVRLESTSGRVRFAAEFVNGVVVTELEGTTGPGVSVPGSAPGASAPDNTGPDNSAASTSVPGDDGDGSNSGPGGGN
jgi:hypothetical protein